MKGLPNKNKPKNKIDTHRKKAKLVNPNIGAGNEKAEKFNKLSIIMGKYSKITCSDGMTEVNLLAFKHSVRRKIEHLPIEEQENILFKFDRFSRLKAQLSIFKRQMTSIVGESYDIALETRKTAILEMFGRHFNVEETHKFLLEDSGLPISFSSVKRFYMKYRVEIEKLQLDYENEIGVIGISRKRSRLEVLDYMLRKTKQDYDKTEGMSMLPFGKEIGRILEQAKKEVEGEQIKLDISGNINITATLESIKSVEQLYSDINFMSYLIARLSVRIRINPLLLQYQLATNWYCKFTGMKRNDSLSEEIPEYPSKIILNWDDLQMKAEKKEKEYKELSASFDKELNYIPTEEKTNEGEKLRQALKEKLREKQNAVDQIKNRILKI